MSKQFKHLNRDTKNGRARVRFKHPNGSPQVTLRAAEGTPEFAAEYGAAMAAALAWVPPTHKVEKIDPNAGRDHCYLCRLPPDWKPESRSAPARAWAREQSYFPLQPHKLFRQALLQLP